MTENQLHVKPKLKFMIRKKLMMAVAMTAATFFSSCTEEHDLGGDLLSKQTIVAEMAEMSDAPQSRTCVDVKNPSTSFVGLLWQVTDKLGVFNQNGAGNVQFSNTSTENAPKAGFSGELSGEAKYAYFPYSENAGNSANSIKGAILAEQPFDPESGSLVCDYKVGQLTSVSEGVSYFSFKQLMTMLRITLDASETALEGERLNNIILTVTDKDGNKRNICGDFTFDATNGKVGTTITNPSNSVSMPWTTRPTLAKGKSYQGFISILPNIVKDDKLNIEVISEGHRATFTANCVTDLLKGYIYNIPLKLKEFLEKFEGKVEELTQPASITSFGFNVADNTGKLLNNKVKWDSYNHIPSTETVTAHTVTVAADATEITLIIPYLYDFKLKPTINFTGTTVKVNGEEFKNGETEVDFTHPVIFTVYAEDGGSKDYTVKVTNTGLPVVVINQSATEKKVGDMSADEVEIGSPIYGGKHDIIRNQLVDFLIRKKEAGWVEDDKITVYNADGTVNCEVYGGTRLRGNTTQEYPKKPLAIKFTVEKPVLGMPSHNRWVLLANWLDHSMIRNTVAFDIAHAMEYAWSSSNGEIGAGVPWNVHGQHVELVVKNADGIAHHVGNYFLCEQIKVAENRLNLTNGCLLELDTNLDEDQVFETKSKKVPFMFKDEVTDDVYKSVVDKVNTIETNLYKGTDAGFEAAFKDLDINSVVDQWLVLELAMNREYADPRSVYMFVNDEGKLSGGPVWDFDRGTFQNPEKAKALCNKVEWIGGNAADYRIKSYDEWLCWRNQESDSYSYVWYKQLIKSKTFQDTVKKRWAIMKPYLDLVADQIQAYGQYLALSYQYDSEMWPTNKDDIRYYKWNFNDWSGDEKLSSFEEVISNFVLVYNARLAGMNTLISEGKFTK